MSISLKRHVTLTQTNDGVVLLDQKASRYWQLNGAGALILRLLLEGGTRQSVADDLMASFGLPRQQADEDVTAFFDMLRKARLINGRPE